MRQNSLTKAATEELEIERTRVEKDESWQSNLDCFLSAETVMKITGWSRQTLWREMKARRFPASIPTSPNRVAWLASEIRTWQRQLIEKRDRPDWKRKGGGRPPGTRSVSV
jgi:prophage regulatory protein